MHAHAHPPRRLPALLAALAVGAASAAAGAQGLTAGGTGGAGGSVSGGPAPSGPALAAPAPAAPSAPPVTPTPSAATPLPGQSTLPSQLPPLNANGMNGAAVPGVGPSVAPAGALPSRSATAAQAFGMLDRGQVGYVTRADTDRIPGFVGFDNADSNRDGQLSPAEFNAAWRFYSGQ